VLHLKAVSRSHTLAEISSAPIYLSYTSNLQKQASCSVPICHLILWVNPKELKETLRATLEHPDENGSIAGSVRRTPVDKENPTKGNDE
jgi:hypothetical protein